MFLIDSTNLENAKLKKDILKDYETLMKELKTYEAELIDKPKIICFTKTKLSHKLSALTYTSGVDFNCVFGMAKALGFDSFLIISGEGNCVNV